MYQYLISSSLVLLVAVVCYSFQVLLGYKTVALLLLVTVSLLAMVYDIYPVLLAAFLSAVTWNFFFIPPVFTFHISKAEDVLMLILYFLVAFINAVLTYKIREAETKARDKEEKEKTIRLYNVLFNSLSHELKTPIATIMGAVDTLKEQSISPEQQEELYKEMETAGNRLHKQVENLLNMSRLESGLLQVKPGWTDVNELIHFTIQKAGGSSAERNILFHPDENLPICKLDSGLIEQVLFNILSNDLQYTTAGTAIQITAAIEENELMITIADEGNGLPDQELQQIFQKFYRVPHTKTGGTGLGLSIAKGFVEAHNGTITAAHNQPHGLQFIIRLPVETTYINSLKNE